MSKYLHKQKQNLYKSLLGIMLFIGVFIAVPFLGNLSADLFQSDEAHNTDNSISVFHIPEYKALAGETGEIAIVAHKRIDSFLGFTADIEFPSNSVKFEGFSTKTGVLDGEGFFIQKNDKIDGKVTMVGATGGDGISIEEGDILFFMSYTINKDIPLATKKIEINFSNMKIIGSDMKESAVETDNGEITILHAADDLRIENFEMSENGSIHFSFNNLLKEVTISDILFEPEAKTEFTIVNTDKESFTLERLDLVGGEKYSITFPNPAMGKNGEIINEESQTLEFYVPKDKSPIFTIVNSEIVSDTQIKINLSEEVNPESVELRDFISRKLEIESFEISDDKKSILINVSENTTISNLTDPDPFKIVYIESETGKPLKGHITDIFQYPKKGPEMTHAIRKDHDSITLYFENPLKDSSVEKSDFEIFKFTSVDECPAYPNLIDADTVMEIAQDGKSVTFKNLKLNNLEEYVVMIKEKSLRDREGDEVDFYQLKRVQNETTAEYDAEFFISSVTPLDNNHIDIEFSQEPSSESIKTIYAEIQNASEFINIYTLEQDSENKKIIHLETGVQKPQKRYIVSLNPQFWKNENGKFLGGKNSFLFTAADAPLIFTISNISPYRVVIGKTKELVITGENFPETFTVNAGNNYELSVKSIADDRKSAVLEIPEQILKGVYNVDILWDEGEIHKKITIPTAFVVEDEADGEISVVSKKNYSSPKKIPNDGNTTTTLFVYIDDSRGLADLEKVTADLRIVGGDAAVELGKGAIENGMQLYILENVTVPETIATSTTPYKIPIVAQNKSNIHAEGYVELWVSKDTTSSVPPVIKSFTVTPNTATPLDSDHPLLFSSEIKDEDGGENITTVALDLSPVQLNTIFLEARNKGQESSKTRFYENIQGVVIPESVPDGKYNITLTVIDAQGEEAKKTIELQVRRDSAMRPTMSSEDSYVTPSNNLVKDGKFTFKIHTKVTDPSGADNIATVSANLSDLGLPPITLSSGVIEGRSQWYSSQSLKIPMSATIGKRTIKITATDKEGNQYEKGIPVNVLYNEDNGTPPQILSDKNYITPQEAINDGETTFAAYIFVKDVDDDVSHVILKLGNIALFAGKELPKGTSSKDINGVEQCISTRTLLCMQPIMREAKGQWYYLPDLIIAKTTIAREEVYELEIVAVDENGKTGTGTLKIPIRTADTILQDGTNVVTVVQASKENEIQILFEKPVNPKDITKEIFKLSLADDKNNIVGINSLTVSPDGKLVTLKTEYQEKGENYALKIDAEKIGLQFKSLSDTIFSVTGFERPEREQKFSVTNIKTISPEKIHLSFSSKIDASSILNNENIEIFQKGTKNKLKVISIEMADKKTLEITTEKQSAGASYNLFYKNIASLYGSKIERKKSISFEAYKTPLGEKLANLNGTADFNNDHKVDFKDFTLFAAVYGKTYKESASGDLDGDGNVDFKDFTLFSSQYGELINPDDIEVRDRESENENNGESENGNNSGNSGTNNNENTHGSANENNGNNSGTAGNSGSGGIAGGSGISISPTPLVYSPTPKPTFSTTPKPLSTPTPTTTPITGAGGDSGDSDSSGISNPTATPIATSYSYTNTPTPTSTQNLNQTATPTPTSTQNANQTATPTPTPTQNVNQTPTPTPTPTPSPACTGDPLACLLM